MTGAGGPTFGGLELGEQRFDRFLRLLGEMDAQRTMLIMTLAAVRAQGYSDEALAALEQDAIDVDRAARKLSAYTRRLCGEWRTQRERPQG